MSGQAFLRWVWVSPGSNPSIERTSSSRLRLLAATAHVPIPSRHSQG